MMDKIIEKMLKEMLGEEPKEKKMTEVQRKPEGYETLIPDEEFEALINIGKAITDYVKLHNRLAVTSTASKMSQATPYARIQLLMLNDFVEELQKAYCAVIMCAGGLNKEDIDKLAGGNVEAFERNLVRNKVLERLLNQ